MRFCCAARRPEVEVVGAPDGLLLDGTCDEVGRSAKVLISQATPPLHGSALWRDGTVEVGWDAVSG